ncbi:AAA family ATPase [Dokdonella sp.]|uniref:ATP-dependent nuclease n=1 Tax=Dokdonella sp. TaxID=2291710 RepID=UPI001AFE6C52|nr:AAA family ATPase [Dokdonella sp.]MBO9663417.1 AAA family ATPase [Dokdonella sp.]
MNLIESIEIAYFRSIYKERLDDLKGLTVFFGRNDSGKSNFLRALNLFFEEHTNPGLSFNFDRDFNHARLEEANKSDGARKFVYIKVYFRSPSNWRNSLGDTFWVKKQWSITKQISPGFETSVPTAKQQYLTRFLNNVKFHYIPAIKDRTIFERLLGKLYAVLSSQREFNESLNSFSEELRGKTEELSEGLLGELGVASTIAPPSDLTELFKSLDFETVGKHGDSYSLTLQRGDGVQVRHIPEILSFLSDRGNEDYHIWGFEEPENSLELASAIDEAARFQKLSGSSNKQIFLTSHSPAFFRAIGDGIRRYFVSKKVENGFSREISKAQRIDGLSSEELPADLMGETPHLAILSSYLDDAAKKIQSLETQAVELVNKLKDNATPILFVEGSSDARVLQAAWDHYVGEAHPLRIEACAGTTKMESLAKDGSVLRTLAPDRSMYVLVDNDKEGRSLRADGKLQARGGVWIQHNSNKTWWCRLWVPSEFQEEMRTLNIVEALWPATLENIFSREVRLRAINDGSYKIGNSPYSDLLTPDIYPKISDRLSGNQEGKIYIMAPTVESKDAFSQWLIAQKDVVDLLFPLKQLVLRLKELMEAAKEN